MNDRKKIKVLHVLPSLVNGGAERLLIDIVKHTNRQKFSLAVLVFKTKGDLYEEMVSTGVKLYAYSKKRTLDLKNLWQMYQAIKNEKPDIVHTHLGGDIYGRLIAYWLKVPVIVSTEHNLNKKEKWLASKAKQWTARWAQIIIAVSEAVKKDASKRYSIDSSKYKVIYNGIDVAHYQRASDNKYNDAFTIGAAGRLVEQKGFKYLIEAVKELISQGQKVRCIIKGDGYLRPQLEQLVKEYQLDSVVSLPGSEPNLSSYYSSLDVFVIPSVWEGLGLVALEAGAAGVLVIASKVDGLEEIIDDGVDGFLVPAADSKALAAKIKYVIDHQSQSREIAIRFQEKVKEKFSIERMVQQYEGLYEQLIDLYENTPR